MSTEKLHFKCRNNQYPDKSTNIERFKVPDDKVNWSTEWKTYNPPVYTSKFVEGKEWADPDIQDSSFSPLWNSLDGNVNRVSHTGRYEICDGYPLNPSGRTGLKGRGLLGKWGPNHAADAIVTKWGKNNDQVKYDDKSGKPILQFVAIRRRRGGEWALPGGMVDAGETVDVTAVREFLEEAVGIDGKTEDEKLNSQKFVKNIFEGGKRIYEGYVDDPRNTDNAWMETVAFHVHDEHNSFTNSLLLEAGDDADMVTWMNIDRNLSLYASHLLFIEKVVNCMDAHW